MVLHIKVVCSQFHRGRLLVTWDPSPRYSLLAQASQISEVVDLSTADEITFKVPFMGQFGMLRTDQGPVATNSAARCTFLSWGNRSTTASFTEPTLVSESNGLITVTVLNDLQCGDATANATLVCSTWFEDMKFAVPLPDTASGSGIGIQPFGCVSAVAMGNVVVQGGEQPDGKSVEYEVPTTGTDHIGMLYAGESCPSLRPLLHRTYLHRVLTFITTASNLVYYQFPRFPIPLNSKGLGYADSITGAPNVGTLNTNLVNTTPIAYITACFVGYRGSLVWKVTSNEAYLGKGTYWGFLAKVASGVVYRVPQTLALSAAAVTRARQLSSIFGSFMQGVSASTQSNSGVTSGVFPMYTNYRMLPGNPHAHYWPSNNAGTYESDVYSNDELVFTGVSTTAGTTDYYVSVAAGTDYNVFGFVNVPDIYVPQLL